ncbi:hypothetical protein KIN20_025499 [Parelaphostrongylus tenuis]|uniref:Uncharacterized protein n=1 Tax=Parelaphostrongylus tenuis TaxID=148309 RepID=A0AAD5MVB6_PARTN|nr:hypothetical protein KIN20_025499 [Parelaphostrongylus tenuis]
MGIGSETDRASALAKSEDGVFRNVKFLTVDDKKPHICFIVSNTMTGICTEKRLQMKCMAMKEAAIPGEHLTISGTLSVWNTFFARR